MSIWWEVNIHVPAIFICFHFSAGYFFPWHGVRPSDKWSTTIHPRMVVHSEEDVNSEFIAMEEEDYERLRELASERVPDESEAAVEVSRNSFQSWTDRSSQNVGSTSTSNRFAHEEHRQQLGVYLTTLRTSPSGTSSFKSMIRQKRLSSGLGEEDRPSLRTQVRTQVLHAFRGLVGTRKTIV